MDFDFVEGSGKFIFFLHGWSGDKNSFSIIKNHIAEINRNMVFVSFMGFGENEEMKKPWTIFDFVDDLVVLIAKIAKGKSVDIVCHSFGARVAVLLASEFPYLVNKIMIVDGAGLKPRRKLGYYLNVAKYKKAKRMVRKGKLPESVLESFGSSDYRSLSKCMKQTFVNVVNFNTEKYARKIKTQILLFWGEKDTETPIYMAKKFKKLIKNSKLVVAKNAGHFSFLDQFDLFFECFKKFLLE